MKAILVQPETKPVVIEIEGTLEALQSAVGGFIEAVYPFDDPVAIVCNEEGKLLGLPLNRALRDENDKVLDILAGDFLIVGLGEERFCSLPEELVEKYLNVYKNIEFFMQTPAGIIVLQEQNR